MLWVIRTRDVNPRKMVQKNPIQKIDRSLTRTYGLWMKSNKVLLYMHAHGLVPSFMPSIIYSIDFSPQLFVIDKMDGYHPSTWSTFLWTISWVGGPPSIKHFLPYMCHVLVVGPILDHSRTNILFMIPWFCRFLMSWTVGIVPRKVHFHCFIWPPNHF